MSKRNPGGLISNTGLRKPSVTDQSQNSGVWMLEEQYLAEAKGTWANQSGQGYEIGGSLRLRASVGGWLGRTLTGSTTDNTTATWSGWVKRGAVGTARATIAYVGATNASGNMFYLEFASDTLRVFHDGANSIQTTAVYRDPSAWYHIVLAFDTTQTNASHRIKLYVNGEQVNQFSTATYPTLNQSFQGSSGNLQTIGNVASLFLDSYIAEVNFIHGQALEPSAFGYFDYNGVWQPKRYTGIYGRTLSYYLPFNPPAYGESITTSTVGLDKSGLGNNFTLNNVSVTAGDTNDLLKDSPTNGSIVEDTGLGGQVAGNYATLNPLDKRFGLALTSTTSEANLRSTAPSADQGTSQSSIMFTSGKWYYEMTVATVSSLPSVQYISYRDGANNAAFYAANGSVGGVSGSAGATFTANDIIGLAVDKDAGTIQFYKNGVSQGGSRTLTNNIAGDSYFSVSNFNSSSVWVNFGQRPFAYAAPAGFKCLNTANLPQPSIPDGKDHFDIARWIGSGESVRDIIGLNFKPDLFYTKVRNGTNWPWLSDSLRGLPIKSYTNDMGTEDTNPIYGLVRSFNSNGFTLGPGTGDPGGTISDVNQSTSSYVAWNWKASDTLVSNTSGSITTQVKVNNEAGFSIIGYTGNGVEGATIGHGLNRTPKLVIIRRRTGGSASWPVWTHITTQSSGSVFTGSTINIGSKSGGVLSLNLTNAGTTYGMDGQTNANASTYVAYCWAEIEGYSRIGTYVGNGSSDGPFVYTGFRPRFIMTKDYSGTTNNWGIFDSTRNPTNGTSSNLLRPNINDAEFNNGDVRVDFLSNGFKLRAPNNLPNESGVSYIYAAFAEHPFKTSRAR
jgi:hypothetical protein